MNNYNNVETLAKASKELMLKEPFYGLLLMSLNKIWSKKLVINGNPTAGVTLKGINYELMIHPDFWESLKALKKRGVLKHELLHLGFFHLIEYNAYENKMILNYAMDIEVNQYIDHNWLPENGCFLESFPELELKPKKGTRYYYKKLMEAQKKGDNPSMKAIENAIANGQNECELPNGQTMQMPDHDWKHIENLPEAAKKLIENQTKHIITQVAEQVQKSRGTIPGEFAELIKRLLHVEPAKFDWKGYIRRFEGNSVKTYTKKSRRKINKRQPDLPGLKIIKQRHILAAIDTSGSVSNKELKEFLGELYHLQKTGADVTIVQCDTAISSIEKFNYRKDLKITGRGGTDFQPVIDYYNEKLLKYSCLMYFTDGEAPTPENARGNILWVISSKGSPETNDDWPGQLIQLPA